MLKFFATNRSLDRLAKAVEIDNEVPESQDASSPDPRVKARQTRIKLERGGYYFVDAEKYMKYYLGTTTRKDMPASAVVSDSESCVFDGFLKRKEVERIVVCVHGYNSELNEAITWFRILTDTMKHLPKVGERVVTSPRDLVNNTGAATAFIGFS